MKHTPGPWNTITQDWNTEKVHSATTGLVIATVTHPHGDDEGQANARLIVKAPELLEALQRAIPWLCKALSEGVHKNTVLPNDLITTVEFAQATVRELKGE